MTKKFFSVFKKHSPTVIAIGVLSAALALFVMAMSIDGAGGMLRGKAMFSVWCMLFLLLIMQYVYLINTKQDARTTLFVEYTIIFISAVACIFSIKLFNIFAIPFALSALLTVTLLNKRIAIINNALLAGIILVAYLANPMYAKEAADIVIIIVRMSGALILVFAIRPDYSRIKTIGVSMLVGSATALFAVLASLLSRGTFTDIAIIWALVMGSEIVGILLTLCLTPVIEWVFRLNTNFRLFEYISFDQPLLKELAAKAPGTFNHSLAVGNLAERCAYAIGENINLAKAAAYYHDVGKLQHPEYFAENQLDGYNPHDELIFETSVSLITRHTEAGYQMLMDKGFPPEIALAAREHHGDSPLNYFYIKAQNITEGELDSGGYRYNGPRPSNKISAIIMIADAVEAATRAAAAHTTEKLREIVGNIINDKMRYGQFDECGITMKDFTEIKAALVNALEGIYHTRISYPDKKV